MRFNPHCVECLRRKVSELKQLNAQLRRERDDARRPKPVPMDDDQTPTGEPSWLDTVRR